MTSVYKGRGRTPKGHYFTSSCIGGNNHYLVLDTLEQLPGLPKED